LVAKLRTGSVDAAAGAVAQVARIVAQLRQRRPKVRILPRGQWVRAGRAGGLVRGKRGALSVRSDKLIAEIARELERAEVKSRRTGRPARVFKDFMRRRCAAAGRVYQQTFIDTYAKVACAKLYDRKTPITATDLLNDRVISLFESNDVKLLRILTDRGSEYCGNPERHEYEIYLAVEEHRPLAHQNQKPADQRHLRTLP